MSLTSAGQTTTEKYPRHSQMLSKAPRCLWFHLPCFTPNTALHLRGKQRSCVMKTTTNSIDRNEILTFHYLFSKIRKIDYMGFIIRFGINKTPTKRRLCWKNILLLAVDVALCRSLVCILVTTAQTKQLVFHLMALLTEYKATTSQSYLVLFFVRFKY